MPEMTGAELALRLRQDDPDLKVLYLTGYSDRLFAEKIRLCDEEAFLEKPCSVAGLLQAVSLAMTRQHRGQEDRLRRGSVCDCAHSRPPTRDVTSLVSVFQSEPAERSSRAPSLMGRYTIGSSFGASKKASRKSAGSSSRTRPKRSRSRARSSPPATAR